MTTINTKENIPMDINIDSAMVHILNLSESQPVLTDYKLELEENLYKTLYKQICNFFKSKNLKFSKFHSKSKIPKLLSKYMNDKDFIYLSKALGQELFDVINSIKDKSLSCDLFTFEVLTDRGLLIGCLNMLYTNNIEHEIIKDGKIGINLRNKEDGLKNKFSQGAFFILDENEDFNLYVVDNKPKKKKDVFKNYFSEKFLQCYSVEDSRTNTIQFINRTESFIKKCFSNAEEKSRALNTLRAALKENKINIYEFAEKLVGNAQEKKEVYCELVNDITKEDIILDNEICEDKLRNITFELEHDNLKAVTVKMTLSNDIIENPNKFEISNNDDGSVNFTVKNITNFNKK